MEMKRALNRAAVSTSDPLWEEAVGDRRPSRSSSLSSWVDKVLTVSWSHGAPPGQPSVETRELSMAGAGSRVRSQRSSPGSATESLGNFGQVPSARTVASQPEP